jgi:hypothetical protein
VEQVAHLGSRVGGAGGAVRQSLVALRSGRGCSSLFGVGLGGSVLSAGMGLGMVGLGRR